MIRRRDRAAAVLIVAMSVGLAAPAVAQSPSPTPIADDLEEVLHAVELMNDAPDHIRASCSPGSPAMDGMLAVAECAFGDDLVLYGRFDGEASLQVAYESIAVGAGLAPDTGTSCAAGTFEGPYVDAAGSDAGRLLCAVGTDGHLAVWTDAANRVLGVVSHAGDGSFESLHAQWSAARLDAADPVAPPTAGSAPPAATAPPPVAVPPAGERVVQWAIAAEASSQFGDDSWSAMQATGPPDTNEYGDFVTAWAPATQDGGLEWLELTYATPVVPTGLLIWETSGNGSVVRVEAWQADGGAWVTLWEGVDDSPPVRYGFSPRFEPPTFATDRIRITLDTDVPGWNEIDSVELTGISAES